VRRPHQLVEESQVGGTVLAVDIHRVETGAGGQFDQIRREDFCTQDKGLLSLTVLFENGVFVHGCYISLNTVVAERNPLAKRTPSAARASMFGEWTVFTP